MTFLEIFDLFAAFMLNYAWLNLVVFSVFSAGLLWIVKPWRMSYVASAVVKVPLMTVFTLLYLTAIIPWFLSVSPNTYPNYPAVGVLFSSILIPLVGYGVLKTIDQDREKPPKNPKMHQILNIIGSAFIIGLFMILGFGGFVNPTFIFEDFSLKFVTLFFVFIGTLMLFIRFILAGLLLVLGPHNPYIKAIKPYFIWIYIILAGSAVLAFLFYLIDNLIKL